MSDFLELDFLRNALAACLLIGIMLSVMGVFVVLRRIVFVGAALAQTSAAGIALAFTLAAVSSGLGAAGAGEFLHDHPESVALAATLVGAAAFAVRPRRVNLPSEGAIGIGFALASTLAILLVAKTPGGEGDTLLLFYGNILAVRPTELLELAIVCPLLVGAHALFSREFLIVSFNPDTARATGMRVGMWNLFLYATLGVGIAFGIRVAGSLLTFSFLVLPALSGLMLARKTWHMAAIAIVVAVVASVFGLDLSVHWDLPSGPTVVAALVAETGVVWAIARLKG